MSEIFEVYSKDEIDEQVLTPLKQKSQKVGIDVVYDYGAVLDYDMVNKTGTDCTQAFQNAANAARDNGSYVVNVPPGKYLILGNLDIPSGVVFKCWLWNQNTIYRGGSGNVYTIAGACLVLRGAQFIVDSTNAFDGFTIYYDQQNYNIQVDGTKADGFSDFVEYAPTFYCPKAYATGIRLEHINYLGGSAFFSAPNGNCESLRINEVYGVITEYFVDLYQSADVPRFTNIHINPTMMATPNWALNTFDNFKTKIAYHFDMFRFRAVDEFYCNGVFAYAVRNYLTLKSGGQTGGSFVNCGADFCHRAFKLLNNTNSFGLKFTNCSFIIFVDYEVNDSGVLVNKTAELFTADNTVIGAYLAMENVFIHSDNIVSDKIIDFSQCNGVKIAIANSFFINYDGTLINPGAATNTVLYSNCQRIGTTTERLSTAADWKLFGTVNFGAASTWQGLTSAVGQDTFDFSNVKELLFILYRKNGTQKYKQVSFIFSPITSSGDDTGQLVYNENGTMMVYVDIDIMKTVGALRYRYGNIAQGSYTYANFNIDVLYR